MVDLALDIIVIIMLGAMASVIVMGAIFFGIKLYKAIKNNEI